MSNPNSQPFYAGIRETYEEQLAGFEQRAVSLHRSSQSTFHEDRQTLQSEFYRMVRSIASDMRDSDGERFTGTEPFFRSRLDLMIHQNPNLGGFAARLRDLRMATVVDFRSAASIQPVQRIEDRVRDRQLQVPRRSTLAHQAGQPQPGFGQGWSSLPQAGYRPSTAAGQPSPPHQAPHQITPAGARLNTYALERGSVEGQTSQMEIYAPRPVRWNQLPSSGSIAHALERGSVEGQASRRHPSQSSAPRGPHHDAAHSALHTQSTAPGTPLPAFTVQQAIERQQQANRALLELNALAAAYGVHPSALSTPNTGVPPAELTRRSLHSQPTSQGQGRSPSHQGHGRRA
jgi:hypothetical protein